MKAWVLSDIGDISLKDVSVPEPGEGWVRVQVKATGICGSDIPRIYETGAHRMPLIPGHEFAGVVDEVGEGVSESLCEKRVAVFPKIPCKKCELCESGRPDLCHDYDYVGSRRDGAFAEYVLAPAENLLELPDSVSMEAAAMIEPLAVAANAVKTACREKGVSTCDSKASIGSGEGASFVTKPASDLTVAVCGMGTIGLMVVLFLKEAGFENIYVIGNREEQREKAGPAGIESDHFCNSTEKDPVAWMKDKTGGIDIYFECVGSNDSIRYGLEVGAPGSLQVIVGNPKSDMTFSRDVYWQIPRNQLKLVGIWNSVFRDDWEYVLERLETGSVDPSGLISHRLTIDELERGFLIMRDKTESYTKVMMVNE